MSLFLLSPFNLVTLKVSSSVASVPWCRDRWPSQFFPVLASRLLFCSGFGQQKRVLQTAGVAGGLGQNFLAKTKQVMPVPWLLGDTHKVFRKSPIQVTLTLSILLGPGVPQPVTQGGEGSILELGLFTMSIHIRLKTPIIKVKLLSPNLSLPQGYFLWHLFPFKIALENHFM